MTYLRSGVVPAGSYTNRVDVAVTTAEGEELTVADDWFGYGVQHDLTVVKTGAGVATSSAAEPYYVSADAVIDFAYLVTNDGNAAVTIDTVTDSQLGEISAPEGFAGVLGAGESVTFTASGPVSAGSYHNTVELRATASGIEALTVSDEWFGFGVQHGLSVVKTGDGVTTPSIFNAHRVAAGTVVEFTYLITNDGNTAVTIDTVVDSELGAVSVPDALSIVLGVGESVTFSAFGPVEVGAYRNTVEVNATVGGSGENLVVSDDWFAYGVVNDLTVVKTGNGVHAVCVDSPHHVAANGVVDFAYLITNAGNSAVQVGTVIDSELGEVTAPEDFTGVLGAGASVTYTASDVVAEGAYHNTVEVNATMTGGAPFTVSDEWFGLGVTHDLRVLKTGNGVATACDQAPHHVEADSTVSFEYVITNAGDTEMQVGLVSDSVLGEVSAPSGFSGVLGAGESVTYTLSGPVGAGAYMNRVDVTATVEGDTLTATDDWFGYGDTEVIAPGPGTDPEPPSGVDRPPTLGETGAGTPWAVFWVALLLLVAAGGSFVLRRHHREHSE